MIETDLEDFGTFRAPAVANHLGALLLQNPAAMKDLIALSTREVLDFLAELGQRLDLDSNAHLRKALDIAADGSLYSRTMLEDVYRRLPQMLRRDVLEELVEHNIGAEYLDGWVETELMGRRIAVRAFGARAVHVIAGNSPIIAMQTVINNAIARSDAIVKLPANEPYAIAALALTMIDMAPDHPLTRHLSVAYWKGGDARIEKRLYDSRNIEKIIAWGGFASMRSIRAYLAPGLDLVALDPKLSASIIGSAAFRDDATTADAARRAAADIGTYNQGGCVSARVLYVETGTDDVGIKRANAFGERVFAELQRLPAEISSPHPHFDPVLRNELAGIRFAPDYRVFGGRSDEGAVIVSQAEEVVDFSEHLDCRVANIVPIDTVTDALHYLTVDTQTVGIYPEELKAQLRDECALRGSQRIVSLGYATSAGMAGPHDAIEVLNRMVRWLRDDTVDQASGAAFTGPFDALITMNSTSMA